MTTAASASSAQSATSANDSQRTLIDEIHVALDRVEQREQRSDVALATTNASATSAAAGATNASATASSAASSVAPTSAAAAASLASALSAEARRAPVASQSVATENLAVLGALPRKRGAGSRACLLLRRVSSLSLMRVVRRLVVCAAAVGEKFQFTVQTRDLDVSRFFFFRVVVSLGSCVMCCALLLFSGR